MECCRKIIITLLFLICNPVFAQRTEVGDKVYITPHGNQSVITNGEIYLVVLNNIQGKNVSILNTKINEVMYVMEIIKNNDSTLLKVFITDPPKEKKDLKKNNDKYYPMVGFKYKYIKKQPIKDFIHIDVPFNISGELSLYIRVILGVIFFMIILPVIIFGRKYFLIYSRNKIKRKSFKEEADYLLELLTTAKTRDAFEEIYRKRKLIKSHLDIENLKFKNLLKEINNYQYREEWNAENLDKVQVILKKCSDCEMKRGV